MTQPLAPVDTVCREATAFAARHPALPEAPKVLGMLTYGLMRAIAECPDCPGAFRVSPDHWRTLVCRNCRGVWVHQETPPAPVKPSARKRKATP